MVQTATAPTAAPENPTAIFDTAIALFNQGGEWLLELFDKLSKPEKQANEVLKRAALVMTLTALETFIESWLRAQMCQKLAALKGSFAGDYIQKKFTESINQLNNPNSHKVRQLSLEFLQFDVTDQWQWNNFDKVAACAQLNKYLTLRGEVVHQGRSSHDPKNPHLVKRDELDKAIRFFRELVRVTVD